MPDLAPPRQFGMLAANAPSRCLIVGEVAPAHDGSLGTAHAFMDAIRQRFPELILIQTHTAGPGAGGSSQ